MVDIFVAGRQRVEIKEPLPVRDVEKKTGLGEKYIGVAERLKGMESKKRLGAFSILPKRVKFETQAAKEKVVLLLRQHWLTQVGWIITAVIMVFLPISLNWIPLIDFMPPRFQFMAVVVWFLLVIALVYEKFISWFYRVFIITDERIIDVDFYNMLYKEVSEAKIDNIEDVTYRHGGMARAFFDFGDVSIQTAAEQREFMIESVPQPSRVVKILNELKLEEEHEKIMGRVS